MTELGITSLDGALCEYFEHSLAPATLALYRVAANRYLKFCHQFNFSPLPLS